MLSCATTLGQSEPGSDGTKGVLHISHDWSLTIRLFNVISRTLIGEVLPVYRCNLYILQPQLTGLVPVRFPSMNQIDLLKNYSYSIGLCAKKTLKKQLPKKCKYECTNAILKALSIK